MSKKINIIFDNDTDSMPLYFKFGGHHEEQQAYITLEIATGDVNAKYSEEAGTGVLDPVWFKRVLTFNVNNTINGNTVLETIEHFKEALTELLNSSTVDWDGNNLVGVPTKQSGLTFDQWLDRIDSIATSIYEYTDERSQTICDEDVVLNTVDLDSITDPKLYEYALKIMDIIEDKGIIITEDMNSFDLFQTLILKKLAANFETLNINAMNMLVDNCLNEDFSESGIDEEDMERFKKRLAEIK